MLCRGDVVIRRNGTAVGFRIGCEATVVWATRFHVKVRNEAGVEREFKATDWMPWVRKHYEHVYHSILYRQADNPLAGICQFDCGTRYVANSKAQELVEQGFEILAKKKITIPYKIGEAV